MMRSELIDVAASIADRAAVDWDSLGSQTTLSNELLIPARIVERIAQVHAGESSVDTFTTSLHDSLVGLGLPPASASPDGSVTWGGLSILEKIGRGTFGDVYRAHDRRLNRTVALKLLRRKDRLESAVIEEGQLMARVRHPNVVTVYGAERIETRVGIWMQLVDGPTLENEVKARGSFRPDEVMQAGIQLAQALGAVHRAGLLHRDIKAQNAMRDSDGRVLLTDFGTGRELSDRDGPERECELAGTPLYMAPEVLRGDPASVSSDIYSLGVLLSYLATGSFPVRGRWLGELREAHQQCRRVLVSEARSSVPKQLAAVIDRAADPDPTRRYRSASDLEAALVACSARPRARRAAWAWAGATALTLTAAVLAGWQWRQPAVLAPSAFQVRDFVLVSRFDNDTGNPMFDGPAEDAVARELTRFDIIDVVPAERIIDTLRLMKRPVTRIVDREIGREICLRVGGVKALITGRIQKTDSGYVMTAELVDPSDGAVIASITEAAGTAATLLPAITRGVRRLGNLFGETRSRIKGAVPVQQLSTSSLTAFQLYNEAVRLYWAGGQAQAAEPIIMRALIEDPEFAAGWMFQAFLLRNIKGPDAEAREIQSREAARKALALSETSPDWERHYLRGVYHFLEGELAASVPQFDAAVRLRPDFEPAVRFLTNTYLALGKPDAVLAARRSVADQRPFDIGANFWVAFQTVSLRENQDEARPYIERLDELLIPARSAMPMFFMATQWRRMFAAYEAWKSGDIAGARLIVDREARQVEQWPAEAGRMRRHLGHFYMTLGRLHDAEAQMRESGDRYDLVTLAHIRDDIPALRSHLSQLPPSNHVYLLVKAGLIDKARALLESGVADPIEQDFENIGRAALASATGDPASAIPVLRQVLAQGAAHLSGPYQEACELLATALVRVHRRAEVISELERCAATPTRFFGNFNTGPWMKNMMRLADEYRTAGRLLDAERAEDRLRRLLVYADADHPLLLRVKEAGGR